MKFIYDLRYDIGISGMFSSSNSTMTGTIPRNSKSFAHSIWKQLGSTSTISRNTRQGITLDIENSTISCYSYNRNKITHTDTLELTNIITHYKTITGFNENADVTIHNISNNDNSVFIAIADNNNNKIVISCNNTYSDCLDDITLSMFDIDSTNCSINTRGI